MAEDNSEVKKIIRGKRSPNYPTLTLEKSIEMVQKLYDIYQQNTLPVPLAMETMGYSIKSGRSIQMLASLSYYGLLDAERGKITSRKVNVTNLAVTIIKHPDLKEREKAIIEAAMKPAIFNKIIYKYPEQLPQDRLLEWELEQEYEFNPKSIKDFITVFRQTVDFAKIYEKGIIKKEIEETKKYHLEEKEDKNMDKMQSLPLKTKLASEYSYTPSVDAKIERQVAMYPVGRDVSIRLIATGPITMKSIEKLIQMLNINKEDFATDGELAIIQEEKESQKKTE